ncbi:MAG: Hsp70 family protein [Deltaproteobacteria bacterium]|nr:MAG: Hsp70 family protein [Deltaproteobacteria bacterium]
MGNGWAIDLGTTNTSVARWDPEAERPRLVELPDICRVPGGEDHLEAPRLVPSAVHLLEPEGFKARLGTWRLFRGRLWGRHGLIGRQALEKNDGEPKAAYAPTFKGALSRSPLTPLARLGRKQISAREVARVFARELVVAIRDATGERLRELVVTAPVDAYEFYRAEVQRAFHSAGVRHIRFLDEPVAAAVGYGLGLASRRHVLVIDFGAGTLDVALVALNAAGVSEGRCEVLAKAGRAIGGNVVDRWLVDEFCGRLDYPLREDAEDEATRFWYRLMVDEARRVKEAVFFKKSEAFYLTPPEEMRAFEARIRGDARLLEVTQDDIGEILAARGLYATLDEVVSQVLAAAARHGVGEDALDDVLMVGGSTLLPRVYGRMEERFGRDRVRAWQPFEAVAYGACAFAADAVSQADFIVHDYAFVTYDAQTHAPEYTIIVPRGTRFPTRPDLWQRKLVPTCSLGQPEHYFKLVISEIGDAAADPVDRRFTWDGAGQLHKLGGQGGDDARVIVPLNEANPTLGYLDPPHSPRDKKPRLEIGFGVNAERWLVATVVDLATRKQLMREEPVVRLL